MLPDHGKALSGRARHANLVLGGAVRRLAGR